MISMSHATGPHLILLMLAARRDSQGDEDQGAGADKTPMPELQYNLKLLVDMCEADIQRMDAKLRHEQVGACMLSWISLTESLGMQDCQMLRLMTRLLLPLCPVRMARIRQRC